MIARRLRTLLCVALASALACAAMGCAKERAPEGTSREGVDTVLLAFLSQARALHHEANLREEEGDVAGARAAMQRLVEAKRPSTPEVFEVLADAYARKAELEVRQGDLSAAAESVQQGLTHATDRGYFRGHLLETSGVVDEARARALTDAGRNEEAAVVRKRALSALEEAISMQAEVIDKALSADGGVHP